MTIILDPGGLNIEMADRAKWQAAPRRNSPRYTNTREKLVLHHTAGGTPLGDGAEAVTIRNIQGFHQNNNGWTDIAYNFCVTPQGQLVELRGFHFQNGANTPENSTSFSVVLLGNTSERPISEAEKSMVLQLQAYLNLPVEACPGGCGLFGHRDVSPTKCPGDSAYDWIVNGTPEPDPCICR